MATPLNYFSYPPRRRPARLSPKKWLRRGAILLGISLPCLILMGIELLARSIAYSRYRIEPTYEWQRPATFGGHQISISKETNGGGGAQRVVHRVVIDGREYMTPPVEGFGCRWYGPREDYLDTAYVVEEATGMRFLAIAERFDAWPRSVYRILRLDSDGSIGQEVFTSANRRSPVYRWMLLFGGTGYLSDVLEGWPGLVYPLIYPFLTGPIGLVMILVGVVARWQQRLTHPS